jgi:hypothetical protein
MPRFRNPDGADNSLQPTVGVAEHSEIRKALRQSRQWLEIARSGEVDATCWIPDDQILARVRPRWTSWQIVAVVLGAVVRVGARRPKVVIFVGPSPEVYHARWLYHLRCMAAHCGVGTQAAHHAARQAALGFDR